MKNRNFYTIGILLGLIPICGLGLLLFIFWIARAWFATDVEVAWIGFWYILISVPVVFIGFVLASISLSVDKKKSAVKILLLVLILTNVPLLPLILAKYGELSSRAYLKIINDSAKDIRNISVSEPDAFNAFGNLERNTDQIIFYHPDYASDDGLQYAGINQNYLILEIEGDTIKKQIPIIHPGEIHQLIIDEELNLVDTHLNRERQTSGANGL